MKRGESARTFAEARDKFALCTPRAPAGNREAPRLGQGQERFVPTVQVNVRTGEVHNSWRPMWGVKALRRRRPRPSWSAANESPTNQGKGTLDAHQLAPNVTKKRLGRGRIEDLPSSICVSVGLITNRHSVTEMDSDSDAPLSSLPAWTICAEKSQSLNA